MAGPVLLGYLDSPMGGAPGHHTLSKVGGSPDWAWPPPSPYCCGICETPLVQVVQVYAPLSGSPHHRTLHLLACTQPPCWGQPPAWRALRSQRPPEASSTVSTSTSSSTSTISTTTSSTSTEASTAGGWADGADDWGDEDLANGNLAGLPSPSPSPPSLTSPSPPSLASPSPPSPSPGGAAGPLPSLSTLSLGPHHPPDRNANSGAMEVPAAAMAEVEDMGEEEDCVAAEEVVLPAGTDIPGLFLRPNRPLGPELLVEPWYLAVGEEGGVEEVGDHEAGLLLEYKAREALAAVAGGGQRAGQAGEGWEEAVPCHGDHYFHHMVTVLQQNPGQVLRYTRQAEAPPLLLRPLTEKRPKCRHCGSGTVLEVQLLPSLVAGLRLEGVEGPAVEFGTVLVYSCLASCWPEGGREAREEALLLQAETM